MCSAGCGDGKVAVVMPPAAFVTVAVVGSCCCDCTMAVVITFFCCKTSSSCCDQVCSGRRCVMAVMMFGYCDGCDFRGGGGCILIAVVDVVIFDEAVRTAVGTLPVPQ
jgi:hypothetical protein